MIRCEAIEEFTLEKFYELKNIKRKDRNEDGRIFVEDRFECDEEMYKYLTGKNKDGAVVVKIIEYDPIKEQE